MGVIKLNECYSQGISKEHLKNGLTDSIIHFMNAIEINQDPACQEFPQVYRKIADIFLLDPYILDTLKQEATNRKVFNIFDNL